MNNYLEVPFTQVNPPMLLTPASPKTIEVEFAPVVFGKDGETPDANDMDGFTVDPLAYYILSRD